MRGERLRIIVAVTMAGVPGQGGATWAALQWVLGLRGLGHEVIFVEPVDTITSEVRACFQAACSQFALHDAALLAESSSSTWGMSYERLRQAASSADLLLNISGVLTDPALCEAPPVRAWVDLDPAFNQLWHLQGIDMGFDSHTHLVTVGLNVGSPGCLVPECGRRWITTPPPVVLEHWPVATQPPGQALTTVANWRAYGSVSHAGMHYGQKAHAVRELIALPRHLRAPVHVVLSIHPDEQKDLAALAEHGWELLDPAATATPDRYQAFVHGSRAELGVAKQGYVVARSGWFGDRSAGYLASGRPVVAQDTGFSIHLPTGEGLLCFDDTGGAAAAVDALLSDEARHRRAARALAEAHLDSGRVLPRLLQELGT